MGFTLSLVVGERAVAAVGLVEIVVRKTLVLFVFVNEFQGSSYPCKHLIQVHVAKR